jgi:hypothetical protein
MLSRTVRFLTLLFFVALGALPGGAQSRAPWPRGSVDIWVDVSIPEVIRKKGATQGKTWLKLRFAGEGLEWDGTQFNSTSHSPFLSNNQKVPRIRTVKGEVNAAGTKLLNLECSEEIFWPGRPSYKKTLRLVDTPVNDPYAVVRGPDCRKHIVRVTEEGVDDAGIALLLVSVDWTNAALAELNISFGGYQTPKPSTTKAPQEDCGPPEQRLEEILHRYRQGIPKGPCSNGMINNVRSIFDHSLDGFRCGGYQGKVLDLLDRLRESKNPSERCLLKDFDYGPIEIGIGLHQAVVIYRKGTDWKSSGLVLDPWFNQTPESYPILQWQVKSCISLGSAGGCTVNGASWLGGWTYYPTVGAPYPGDAGKRPKPPTKAGRIAVNCPLIPCLVDEQGRVSGYRQGQTVNQIPGVVFMSCTLEDGSPWTEFEFSPRPGLRLALEGSGAGQATVVASLDQSGAWQYRMAVQKGDAFKVPLTTPRSAMQGPKGAIPASTFGTAELDALAPRLIAASSTPAKASAVPPRFYRHPEGAYRVPISSEWTLRERTPQANLDMLIRTPDRDNCAVYFGRDHDDAARKGIDASLDAMVLRVAAKAADRRTERIQIGTAKGVLISTYDAQSKAMLWHLCLGQGNRIFYAGVEALPNTGRRELPTRIRELFQSIAF